MRNSLLYIPSSQEPISPLSFEGEFFFFRFSQSAVECKLANILHLAFSEKTPYLLWHTCLQGSCLCHRIFTAISDAVEPLAHVLCCTTVMGCQWKQEPISTHLPCRNPKMLVVSSQTWKSKKERTQNLQTMVRRTSIFRQCYALIVIAVEKFFYTGSCCSHNWDFLWAVSLHRWSHGEILNCPQMQGKKIGIKVCGTLGKTSDLLTVLKHGTDAAPKASDFCVIPSSVMMLYYRNEG